MRSLVTIRRITDIQPIANKDMIVCAFVEGWTVVVKKDQFQVGDPCVYFEPDCFLPEGDPRWQFLVEKRSKEYDGKRGHVLRTIRLGGVYSNGFCSSLSEFPELEHIDVSNPELNVDVTEILNIQKYDPPEVMTMNRAAGTKGNFPSFLQKTDKTRAQSLKSEIFNRESKVYSYIDGSGNEITVSRQPMNTDDTEYEVTMKVDGSSMTVYSYNGTFGVCSRNLDLKVDEPDGNTFVLTALEFKLNEILPALASKYGNFAIQSELMGPKVQANPENFDNYHMFVFEVYDINTKRYVEPDIRYQVVQDVKQMMSDLGVPEKIAKRFQHVPILHKRTTLKELGVNDVADLLKMADGPSIKAKRREGLVFTRHNQPSNYEGFTFKAISEDWLAAKKD